MNNKLPLIVKKTRTRIVPLMLMLYILAFLDRSNIGFAKASFMLDTGLTEQAFALGAGIFFVAYAFLNIPANMLMRKIGPRTWIGCTTLVWGFVSMMMGFADTEAKFLAVRVILGAAEAAFFPGMIYLASQWFPAKDRGYVMGLLYMGAPLAFIFGSPLSGALLEMHGALGHPGWFWMFIIEGGLALLAGIFTLYYLDNSPQDARFLSSDERAILIQALKDSVEENKATAKLTDALKNIRVWHFALIYMIIQISVYGLTFYLPTQVAALMGEQVGFKTSLVTAIPWIAALIGTILIPRWSDKTQERRFTAAATLAVAGLGILASAFVSPALALLALCFAAIGFIAVQPVYWTMPTASLSGAALAGGIGFINMFGAIGGFLAPNIKVAADTALASSHGGLVVLGIITLIGAVLIMLIKMSQPQKTTGEAHAA